jgi:C4-dicarboxylate transporter, DctM subunit
MGPIAILILVTGVLIILILSRLPVGFALAVSGGLGLVLIRGDSFTSATLSTLPYNATARFGLLLIPMFILMGMLALHAGIAQAIYATMTRYMGRIPGGLGIATVAACAGFAAVTGSSAATVATIGRMSINEMRKAGYSPAFAAGIVASGGTLGVLIPPSVILVIYGIITGESIGRLLLAGIIPGILSALLYVVVVLWRQKSQVGEHYATSFAQQFPALLAESAPVSMGRGVGALAQVTVLFGIIVGGIYSGIFTATESGAVAAFVALLFLLWSVFRRRATIKGGLSQALLETASLTSMIFMLLIGGALFALFMVTGGYAQDFASLLTGLPVHGLVLVALLLLAIIPLGMFLDGLSILFLTVPLAYPVISELGYSGVWFGILMVKMVEIGLITPPVGINVYVVAGAAPGLRVEDAFRGVWPFGLMDVMTVGILFAFPVITTILPDLAGR